jgi:hypothetical protein
MVVKRPFVIQVDGRPGIIQSGDTLDPTVFPDGSGTGGGTPAGPAGAVQLNGGSGAFSGTSGLTYNGGTLTIQANGTDDGLQWRDALNQLRLAIHPNGQIDSGATFDGGTDRVPLRFADAIGDKVRMYGTGDSSHRWGLGLQSWAFVQYMDPGAPGVGRFSWRQAAASGDPSTGLEVLNLYTTGTLEQRLNDPGATGLTILGAFGQTAPLVLLRGLSSTATPRDLAYIDAGYSRADDATYLGYLSLRVQDSGNNTGAHPNGWEGLRVESTGTGALVTLPGSVAIGTSSGLAKLTSGVVSAAVAGTDYLTPSGSGAALTGITAVQTSYNDTTTALGAATVQGAISTLAGRTATIPFYKLDQSGISSGNARNDEFDGGPGLNAKWTLAGNALATADVNSTFGGGFYLKRTDTGSKISIYYQNLPTLPCDIYLKATASTFGANFCRGGGVTLLPVSPTDTSSAFYMGFLYNSGTQVAGVIYSTLSTFGSTVFQTPLSFGASGLWLRITVLSGGTTANIYWSVNGTFWTAAASAVALGFTAANCGIGMSPEGQAGGCEAVFDWFRVG